MNISFKGYDAVPIKNLYLQSIKDSSQVEIIKELQNIGNKENFGVKVFNNFKLTDGFGGEYSHYGRHKRWSQDDKHFAFLDGKEYLLVPSEENSFCNSKVSPKLANFVPNVIVSDVLTPGGNMFIGKKDNGDKWLLIGFDDFDRLSKKNDDVKKVLSNEYDIKEENIHVLSQPDFHLDMAIRPIGYPYVLVNDFDVSLSNIISSFDNESKTKVTDLFIERKKNFFENKKIHCIPNKGEYVTTDEIVKELEEAGFIAIRIGGVYGSDINFMNAIVNKHSDDTISYITNSTKYSTVYEEQIEEIFKKELSEKVPNLRDVFFVSGGMISETKHGNGIMTHLADYEGGIHCLTCEEPNFEAWG